MEKALKIIVAVLLIFTVFSLPPDLYRFVSLIVMVSLGILAYNSHVNKKLIEVLTYIVLIVIFQPFYTVTISPILWKSITILAVLYLIGSSFFNLNKVEKQ
ncbi:MULTISPECIES: DUF6804 family protein [Myroides]|uniref:Uncharacterized protein n=1 Tax=Myroides albus TaxID=2562892 RepID=A0A6I3LN84_9FLAO|nr:MULTISPECIES: DUF6804 family protein [Myroides]MTG99177.1 hypothetical protein [Myroides albus]MVX36900.1 hypothetical protein [Myroides sp. LoEW2-1]UVD80201.1 hypothetical protein NWE55_02630 [Myroides albus]